MKARQQWQFPAGYYGWENMCDEIDNLRSVIELQKATIEELNYRLADYITGFPVGLPVDIQKHDCIRPIAYKVRRKNDGVEYGPFETLQEANVWIGTHGHNELICVYPPETIDINTEPNVFEKSSDD